MSSQQSFPGKDQLAPLVQKQHELEAWSTYTGGRNALGRNWEKGCDGFISHAMAEAFLRFCLAKYTEAAENPRNFGAIWALMADKRAVLQVAAECLIHVVSHEMDGRKRNSIAAELGRRAEFVLWLHHPIWRGSAHLKGLRKANGRTLDMGLMRKRLMDKGNNKAAQYKPLTKQDRLKLGTMFLELVSQSTGLMSFEVEIFQKGRKALVCRMTEKYWSFMKNWQKNLALYWPIYMPMLVPPEPWQSVSDGGYLTLSTTCSTIPWERWDDQMRGADPCVLGSINYLQSIPFRFNHEQIALQREIWNLGHAIGGLPSRDRMERPSDREFRERRKETGEQQSTAFWNAYWKYKGDQRKNTRRSHFINSMVAYDRLKEAERLFWVWFDDHRGRKYQRGAQLSFLGASVNRTQVMFDRAAPMAPHLHEFFWALGDAFGLDKDQDIRDMFAVMNWDEICNCGHEPLERISWWEAAKDPWRFVSLCREARNYSLDEDYETRLVFQIDQTCSGYGHTACLLRDARLAELTNVIGEAPWDLYGQVLETSITAMQTMYLEMDKNDERQAKFMRCIEWWQQHQLDRSLIKLCVMPVIYGQTTQSRLDILETHCRDILGNFLTEDGLRIIDLAIVANRGIQIGITEWMPGVMDLQKWLKKAAKRLLDHGKPPYWVTPNGRTVLSYAKETSQHDMYLELSGRRLRVSCGLDDGPMNERKTYAGLCADYVHSMDAAFAERFIWHWKAYKYPIVTVHDCFGTSLDKVLLLNEELRDQFSRFYSVDHLAMTKARIEEATDSVLPEIPCVGTLNLHEVGENPFLFC